jgi:hypothetical protein
VERSIHSLISVLPQHLIGSAPGSGRGASTKNIYQFSLSPHLKFKPGTSRKQVTSNIARVHLLGGSRISFHSILHYVIVPTQFGKLPRNHPTHDCNHCTILREHNQTKLCMHRFCKNTYYVLYGDMVIPLQVFITKIPHLTK